MDERPRGQRLLELYSELVDVDVDRTVTVAKLSSPDDPVEVLTADDPPLPARQGHQQLEFPDRNGERPLAGDNETVVGTDLQVADAKHLSRACRFHDNTLSPRAGAPVTEL